MKHNNNKEIKISFWASHFTTIVSVTLVLILVGLIAMVWTSARNETRRLQEQLELNVILGDSVTDAQGKALADSIGKAPYAGTVKFISRDEAMRIWTRDTGEDLVELFGVNPLSPEVAFTVRSQYSSKQSLAGIKKSLEASPLVASVSAPDDSMVDSMQQNLTRITLIRGIVALVMILISLVLITNTVNLAIYSRRFTIHTMQLVGATDGFVRRPIVWSNMLGGLVAGLLAAGITALALWGARQGGLDDVARYIPWSTYAVVAAGMILAGMVMCSLAAFIAASHYLRKDYDELFK